MEKRGLKDFEIGEEFIGFCIIRKKELRHKQNGEPYLSLELGDRSGRLRGTVWQKAETYFEMFKVGEIIKVKGKVQSYMDTRQLRIEKIRAAKPEEISLEKLVPTSKKDVASLKEKFKAHMESIENPYLQELLQSLFPDEETLDKYLETPSGKLWHHNYLYGTLEQIVCMLDLTEVMEVHYPALQTDLLKSGIILRYLGGLTSFRYRGFIDYSTSGRLVGSAVNGYQQVRTAIRETEEFPTELETQLLHLLLSREIKDGENSPVKPMTLEAIVLNLIEETDIQTNAALRIIENDRLPDSRWTRYNNLFDRFIYVPQKPDDDEDEE